ncbi:MAG: polyphosphate kinase 1, partial [Bacteroidota bacterium]
KTKKKLEFEPKQLLKQVLKIINKQQEEFSRIFEKEVIPELKGYNINLLRRKKLNEEQIEFIEDYFRDNMLPFVQPVLLVKKKIKPFLNNAALYLSLWLKDRNTMNGKTQYAIVKIPSDHLPRFIQLPSHHDQYDVIMLDDIVRHNAKFLFPGYNIIDSFSIKLTRDAELYIEDEFSGDLIQKIKKSLNKRDVGPASRLVYDREMPEHFLHFLMETFDLEEYDLLPEGRYHNNFAFFKFPDFGMKHLKNTPLPPLPYAPLENADSIFSRIRKRDHLIHVPYHAYESVVLFFEQAARDPKVTHIKIVQYRVAKKSRIMNALIDAVKAGKQVSVFIEVKARFDEKANLRWGEKLEEAGVTVHYSFPGLKVHSKLALITREERDSKAFYAYLSTGNFHEDTAKIYSDFGLFTADQRLTREVARIFSFLETVQAPRDSFQHLLVGQFNLRKGLEELIAHEINNAKAGKEAWILLKMNSLQDRDMIERLYEANNAGVKIRMIIRGICSLVPGIPGQSENIEAISIVDRFLEHARVFVFCHSGEETMYLSSADWMVRNLSYRIETCFPIYNDNIKKEIRTHMEIQWSDNVKARLIDEQQSNEYRRNESDMAVRSQMETYFHIKRQMED